MENDLGNSDLEPATGDMVQAYDSATEMGATIGGGRKRSRRRRTRGKRHTPKKAYKAKSRKLRSRRPKRRRRKSSRRRRRGGSKGCVSGTAGYAIAGNTLSAGESMLASPPSASMY
jgi:hypothetical protein